MTENNYLIKLTILILFAGSNLLVAQAFAAETGSENEPEPYSWDIKDNVSLSFNGYVQADAYTVDESNASFGTGTVDRPFDTFIRRAYLIGRGKIFDWQSLLVYDFSSEGDSVSEGLIWAWLSRDIGPGTLFIGQHWDYSSLEEPVSGSNLMFLGRNFNSSSGISSLFNHVQGLFYQISEPYGQGSNNVFWGIAAYSLNNTISSRDAAPGYGVNTQFEWAPVVEENMWYQLGGALVHLKAHGTTGLSSAAPFYAGFEQPAQIIANYPNERDRDNPTKDQVHLNFAGSFGSLFLLGEYAINEYNQDNNTSDNVEALSVQAGYWLTGEVTPFDRKIASYGVPTPIHGYGAVQVGFGYGRIKNKDVNDSQTGAGRCIATATADSFSPTSITNCSVENYRFVANYWVNPRVRFTGQVTKAVADLGDAGKDDPWIFELRAQWAF